jgi:hypothetical protein
MRGTIRDYILSCEAEGVQREAAARKETLLKQSNCEHKNKSRAEHIGNGFMSQHCMDCGKDFGYIDRD